jgi:membrane protein DedA with SNARE-associated domain
MARHGDKSIILARFTPGARAFIPVLAGMLGMPARRFYLANIAPAVVWAPSNVVPGVIVGESLDLLGAAAKPLGIHLVLLIVLAWIMSNTMRFILPRNSLASGHDGDAAGLGSGPRFPLEKHCLLPA